MMDFSGFVVKRQRRPIWIFLLMAVQILCRSCSAWVPPHPDSDHVQFFESVHDMRLRLGMEYNYTPRLIHPELCRFLSEQECQDHDEAMMEHAQQHRRRAQMVVTEPGNNPPLGKVKVLVLLILFPDQQNRERLPKETIEEQWNGPIKKWFSLNSFGKYEIEPVVVDWFVTDNTEAHYSFGKRGIVDETQQMAWPVLNDLDNRQGWDWSQFDSTGDGKLDAVVMLHSGYGGEAGTEDCFGTNVDNRLWAHAYSSKDKTTWRSKDGSVGLNGYTIASAYKGKCGANLAEIGLVIHEYMHTLGLIDLYDVNPEHVPGEMPGIGAFCIMAFPYGQGKDGNKPGHLSVYSRQTAKWIEPKEVAENTKYTLKPLETSDDAYRITLADFGFYPEYLLIENRQPLEFDSDMWQGGIVIYHVDDSLTKQDTRGFPGQQGWPQNGNHYKVAVLPKDGLYELEQGIGLGNAGDMWMPGDSLGPGQSNTIFPNTDAYQGGYVFETGVRINILSQEGNDFTIGFEGIDPSKFPAYTSSSSPPVSAPDTNAERNQAPPPSDTDNATGVPIAQANTALLVVGILIFLSLTCWLIPLVLAHYNKQRQQQGNDNDVAEAAVVAYSTNDSVTKDQGKEGSNEANKDEVNSITNDDSDKTNKEQAGQAV